MPHLRYSLQVQSHLWKLLATGDAISTFVGNMSLNLSNPNNPFHIQLHRNISRYIIACVSKPYLLLAGN